MRWRKTETSFIRNALRICNRWRNDEKPFRQWDKTIYQADSSSAGEDKTIFLAGLTIPVADKTISREDKITSRED
jgi:hypothetical protein